MPSLVFFTRVLPSGLVAGLEANGYTVYEALAISEVLHLCEQYDIQAIVVDSSVKHPAARELLNNNVTLWLKPNATAAEVIWELSRVFPPGGRLQ